MGEVTEPGMVQSGNGTKKKKKRKLATPVVQTPVISAPVSSSVVTTESDQIPLVNPLADELVETKQRLERVTKEMEGMKSEMATLRMEAARSPKIFALGFVPSVVLAKSHLELLKWVSDVLSIKMKEKMGTHRNHFKVIESVSGVESVGIRTCPVYNRIEFCTLKWHHRTKITKSGRPRADLRLHCCTLCMEALGIICGHPLLQCPWIYEETWRKIPEDN